ncbi:MAG: hypothetical protein ACI9UK_000444 [Candidatus Krumholzibacteriia bacterium]
MSATSTSTTEKTDVRTCRLLYYGPKSSGKRQNLRVIHSSVPPEQRLMLAGDDPERQIAFQVKYGDGGLWQVLVQSVDAGKERLRSAGMPFEPPFDGIVFIVDSSAASLDQNLASFESLKTYLDSWGLDVMDVPLVIQYNGRDRENTLRVDRLESLLNPWGLLSFPASAKNGEGVREALKAILGLTVNHIESKPSLAPEPSSNFLAIEPSAQINADSQDGLGIDYGPPIQSDEVTDEIPPAVSVGIPDRQPSLVVPVKIPRSLLLSGEPVRFLFEVTIDDSDG